jgi:hypothetical protein
MLLLLPALDNLASDDIPNSPASEVAEGYVRRQQGSKIQHNVETYHSYQLHSEPDFVASV